MEKIVATNSKAFGSWIKAGATLEAFKLPVEVIANTGAENLFPVILSKGLLPSCFQSPGRLTLCNRSRSNFIIDLDLKVMIEGYRNCGK